MPFDPISIRFAEQAGIPRTCEPVSFGVPLAQGTLFPEADLILCDDRKTPLPFGHRILASWPDGSIRWLLLDTQVSVAPKGGQVLILDKGTRPVSFPFAMTLEKRADRICIDTGAAVFDIAIQPELGLFRRIRTKTDELTFASPAFTLKDAGDTLWSPVVREYRLEHDTRMKKVVLLSCGFSHGGKSHGMGFDIRVHFYAGLSRVRLDIAIHNPRPAFHRGGLWDLGDPNAMLFKSLDFRLTPVGQTFSACCYGVAPGQQVSCTEDICVFQASSGGEHWDSSTHVNASNHMPNPFKGFKVFLDGKETERGDRALPMGAGLLQSTWVSLSCQRFWQNFAKTMNVGPSGIGVGLFPEQFCEPFELQPGERKTHTLYLSLGREPGLWGEAAENPLVAVIPCKDLFRGMTTPRPVPFGHPPYDQLIQEAIGGAHAFPGKNEAIDEFGWRHFGDVWADHESAFSPEKLISHYNNQYDLIKGFLLQFMRSGDVRWFTLAKDMGNHVTDIDIYHTDQDKSQYNGGLFWHTDHYLPAGTSTHRTFSREHLALSSGGGAGGGPAPDHNYATGLLYLYWLTGERRYRQGVLSLAGNIIHCINAPNCLCEMGVQVLKSLTSRIRHRTGGPGAELGFNGPSRSSGNSLNTLMDAYLLTEEPEYLLYAEDVIARSVSEEDDFEQLNLLHAETRWMYTIFLQALGRYLAVKGEMNRIDARFFHAQAVLLRYARWMADHEYSYLKKPDLLEYPTETWAAQDIRKADIFAFAAGHSKGALRELFIQKSRFFLEDSLKRLNTFDTRFFVRPMAVVMTNGLPSIALMAGESPSYPLGPGQNYSLPRKRGRRSVFWRNCRQFSLKKELRWLKVQLNAR